MTGGAPPGGARRGRLVFADGASRLHISGGDPDPGLYRVWPAPRGPRVREGGDLVIVRFPRPHPARERLATPEGPSDVALGAGVRWEIAFRGAASYVDADLRGLDLNRLAFDGGAVRVTVVLPAPQGTVRVRILGGASHVAIYRPRGIPVRLRVDGGATAVAVDDQRIGVAGGNLSLHAPGDGRAAGRYEVAVSGGANVLAVGHLGTPTGQHRAPSPTPL